MDNSGKIREHILRIPNLYIGREWNADGLHFLTVEVIKLAMAPEYLNEASILIVTIEPTGAITIKDDGRGLPIKPIRIGQAAERSPIEHILTGYIRRHPNHDYYQEFGFLDYLGTVMCAVAKHLRIEIIRNGALYAITCSQGKVVEPLKKVTDTAGKGTKITFLPDPDVFSNPSFDSEKLNDSLSQLAMEYPEIEMKFEDKRTV